MTRREKVQLAILQNVHDRDSSELGPDALSFEELAGYSAVTVRAVAEEMVAERLLEARVEGGSGELVEAVRPIGLTDRGEEYRLLLAERDRETSAA